MKKFFIAKYLIIAALFVAISALTGCRSDFDFDYAHGDITDEDIAYNDHFAELVGDIDPSHNWSTAVQSGIRVSVDMPGTHLLRIYTADPLMGTAFLLAKYENVEGGETTELTFDVPASLQSFCAVLDSAEQRISKMVELDGTGSASFIIGEEDRVGTTRATRAAPRRDYSGCYTFHSDNDAVYKSSCPENITSISDYYQTINSSKLFKVETTTSEVNCYGGNCDVYFPEGTYTISSWYIGQNTNVYLLPGANVTFTMDAGLNNNQANVVWSVAEGATMTVTNNISYGFKLYNRGTITCKDFEIYSPGSVYNAGTITTGLTKVANYNTEFVNAGTLTCSGVNVEGSGKFQNIGNVRVSGNTVVNSNNCTWRNEGSYTTNNYTYNAGSTDVINTCKLKVNNLFEILLGDTDRNCFEISSNGSVETKDFKMGIGYLLMGSKSVLKVTGEAIMNITKAHYGIYGIGDEYAVLEASEVKKIADNQGFCATYGGKLYVATQKHFAQGKSGDYPYYAIEGEAKMQKNASISIASSDCSAGYNGGSDYSAPEFVGGTGNTESNSNTNTSTSETVDTPMHWIIACEDLPSASSDFDYNDVVYAVYHAAGTKTYQIKPLAAGGTLRAEILYRESADDYWNTASVTVNGNELSEVHQWISKNPDAPHNVMLNTSKNINVKSVVESIPVCTIEFGTEVSMSDFATHFAVRVYQDNSSDENIITHSVVANIPGSAQAPRLFCINSDVPAWQWMEERKPLYSIYTDFASWASNASSHNNWYRVVLDSERSAHTIEWIVLQEPETDNTTTNSGSNNQQPAEGSGNTNQNNNAGIVQENVTTTNYVLYVNGAAIESNRIEVDPNGTFKINVMEVSYNNNTTAFNDVTYNFDFIYEQSGLLTLSYDTFTAHNSRVAQNEQNVFGLVGGCPTEITGSTVQEGQFDIVCRIEKPYVGTTDKTVQIYAKKKTDDTRTQNTICVTIKGEAAGDNEIVRAHSFASWFTGKVNGQSVYLNLQNSVSNGIYSTSYRFEPTTVGTITAKNYETGEEFTLNVNVANYRTGTETLCSAIQCSSDWAAQVVHAQGTFPWYNVKPGSVITVKYTHHDNGNNHNCSIRLADGYNNGFHSFGNNDSTDESGNYVHTYILTQSDIDKLSISGFAVMGSWFKISSITLTNI